MSTITPSLQTRTSSSGPAAQVGYWVFGPEGWIGTVVKVWDADDLLVRTGLFHPRLLVVSRSEIQRVRPGRRAVVLRRDPRVPSA